MNKDKLIDEVFALVKNHEEGDAKSFERIDEILDAGITIDECVENSSDKTPIMGYALYKRKNDIVYYFLDKGGDALQADACGSNLLHDIAILQSLPVADDLICYIKLFKDVVEKSKKPLDLIRSTDGELTTPLHLLAGIGLENLESVKCCIENGADVNALDSDGETPLHYAIDEIKSLLSSGSSINLELIELLLENNADIQIKNNNGISFADAIYELKADSDNDAIRELVDLVTYKTVTEVETKAHNIHKNKIKSRMRNRPKIGGIKR